MKLFLPLEAAYFVTLTITLICQSTSNLKEASEEHKKTQFSNVQGSIAYICQVMYVNGK